MVGKFAGLRSQSAIPPSPFTTPTPVVPDIARRAAIFRSGPAPLPIPKGRRGYFSRLHPNRSARHCLHEASPTTHTPLIKYAVFDGAHWTVETRRRTGDDSPSLALRFRPDPPIIVYAVHDPMAVMYARRELIGLAYYARSSTGATTRRSPLRRRAIPRSPMSIWSTTPPSNMPSTKTAGSIIWLISRSNSRPPSQGWYYWYYPSLAFNPVTGEPAIAYFQYDTGCIKYAVGRILPRDFGDIVTDIVTAWRARSPGGRGLGRPARTATLPPSRSSRNMRGACADRPSKRRVRRAALAGHRADHGAQRGGGVNVDGAEVGLAGANTNNLRDVVNKDFPSASVRHRHRG